MADKKVDGEKDSRPDWLKLGIGAVLGVVVSVATFVVIGWITTQQIGGDDASEKIVKLETQILEARTDIDELQIKIRVLEDESARQMRWRETMDTWRLEYGYRQDDRRGSKDPPTDQEPGG